MGTPVHVVHEAHCPDIGPVCAEREEPPQIHDQQFYIAELRPILEYGLAENLSAEVQLPLKLNRTTIVYRHMDGTLYEPDYANIHHRNELLYGPSDPWLSARVIWSVGRLTLGGRLGASLPLGRTEENPFILGREGTQHQHLQFGTGTVDPIVSLEASAPVGPLNLSAYARAQLTLYENAHGYRAGNRLAIGFMGEGVIVGALRASLGIDIVDEQPERWNGHVEQDGNLGRTDFLVGAALHYPFQVVGVSLGIKVPLYSRIAQMEGEAGQLSYPAIVTVGMQRTFDLRLGH